MKLTRRQQMVLRNFLDLYREKDEALHYTELAEHLGVSTVTAYDMLRLLEDRGLLISEFVPSEKGAGGRARVVFRPTPTGVSLLESWAGSDWEQEEWEIVKDRIVQALEAGKGSDYQDLLDDLLIRVESQNSPLLYTAEMVTAVILQAYQLKEHAVDSVLFTKLADSLNLNAFGGLAVGFSYVERANRRTTGKLLAQVGRYQEMIAQLNEKSRHHLADFVSQIVEIIDPKDNTYTPSN